MIIIRFDTKREFSCLFFFLGTTRARNDAISEGTPQ